MQHQIEANELLKMLDSPAFAVADGTVIHANNAALQRQVTIGMQVESLLLTGSETYKTFTDGRLHLRLCIADTIWDASVTKSANTDIFLMERTINDAELRVLSLAALQLRTPLTEILSLTENLSAHCDEESQEIFAKLNKTLFSIQRFVGNMADASRYSSSTNCLMKTQNISAYFREILEKSQSLLAESGYILNYTLPKEDIYAFVSTERLERATYNLLANAIKFSPADSTISAKLENCGDMLLFTVTNESPGLSADISGNIFTRYLRDPSIEDSRMGMGLGMLYVCAAASAHGGTVLIRHPEGKGLSVTMTISTKPTSPNMVRSDILQIDYTGCQDHALLELSDVLSSKLYK